MAEGYQIETQYKPGYRGCIVQLGLFSWLHLNYLYR